MSLKFKEVTSLILSRMDLNINNKIDSEEIIININKFNQIIDSSEEKVFPSNEVSLFEECFIYFIINKNYFNVKKYLKYAFKINNNSLKVRLLKIISKLNLDELVDNFGELFNGEVISQIRDADEFVEMWKFSDSWEIEIKNFVERILSNPQPVIIRENLYSLCRDYIEIFGSIAKYERNHTFYSFIYNSIIFYIDTRVKGFDNLSFIKFKKSDLFSAIYDFAISNNYNNNSKIQKKLYIDENDEIEIVNLTDDIIKRYNSTFSDGEYRDIEYSFKNNHYTNERIILSKSIQYLNYVVEENVKNLSILNILNNTIKIINNVSNKIDDSIYNGFIYNCKDLYKDEKLLDILDIIQNSSIYSGNLRKIADEIKYIVWEDAPEVKQVDINDIDFDIKSIRLITYLNEKRIRGLIESSYKYIRNYLDDNIKCLLLDYDKISLFNNINKNGIVIIPIALTVFEDEFINKVCDSTREYEIRIINNIMYIIDKRFKIHEDDMNLVRGKDVVYDEMDSHISVMESLIESIDDSIILEFNSTEFKSALTNKLNNWNNTINSKLQKVRDIDYKLSNEVDNKFAKMETDIKMAYTSKNREAILNGRLIPSFSQLIRLAVASSLTSVLCGPIIGSLSFITGLAISKRCTKAERKIILDEIDVELSVIEEQIGKARANEDTAELRSLLKVKKALERDRKKIFYKVKDYTIFDNPGNKDD